MARARKGHHSTRLQPAPRPGHPRHHHLMRLVLVALRWILGRLSVLLVVSAVVGRAVRALRDRGHAQARRRQSRRDVLPSLFDRHPGASTAARRRIGLKSVPLDRIVGTMRNPSQNTADFLPLPGLRGANWQARWQRINRALNRLESLPPVDLVQVGDEYYVEDGHNRVAAARLAGAGEIDADVTQLNLPGVTQPGQALVDPTSLVDADVVRRAGSGRYSPTVEQRSSTDTLSREDLLRDPEQAP